MTLKVNYFKPSFVLILMIMTYSSWKPQIQYVKKFEYFMKAIKKYIFNTEMSAFWKVCFYALSTLWGPSCIKGPVQSKSMFISIDQLPKTIEFHTIIVHNYSSVDFILIFEGVDLMVAAILKNL